jgi:D-alanyl-D-alanine carboxypeptidase
MVKNLCESICPSPRIKNFRRGHMSKFLFIIILLSLFSLPAEAAVKKHHHHRLAHHQHLSVDGTASYADIVIDAESGQILHASSADQLRHPASLTKMMTLYLTFQALEAGRLGLNQYLPISANAAEQPPSKLGLRPGQRIRVEDAIMGLVTESANDAAMVLAEWLGGGSEQGFAQMMTKQAHALGMDHTRYDNPSGLPDADQVTTARDMAVLGHALIYHFPQYYPYFSRDSFTYAGIYHHNHNHLMDRYDGMDGIKTGYIRASGFNLVASAQRGGTRLIGVVFGGRSTTARDNRMAQLLDQAFVLAQHAKPDQALANVAQGDSGDDSANENSNYVALPAKVAVVFTPAPTPAPMPVRNRLNPPARLPAMLKVPSNPAPSNPAPPPGGGWGIQIGAYSDPEIGREALAGIVASMPQVLSNAEPQVQKIGSAGAFMYRARLMSLDENTALNVCAALIRHGQGCMTVSPN